MYYLVGFIIAIAVGLTGIGGGSFTVPALVLLAGLTAGEAVGTAFLFAGVLRLIAAPFYLLGKQIHSKIPRSLERTIAGSRGSLCRLEWNRDFRPQVLGRSERFFC